MAGRVPTSADCPRHKFYPVIPRSDDPKLVVCPQCEAEAEDLAADGYIYGNRPRR